MARTPSAWLPEWAQRLFGLLVRPGTGGERGRSCWAQLDPYSCSHSPGSLVISAYAVCPDITATVTPDLKHPGGRGMDSPPLTALSAQSLVFGVCFVIAGPPYLDTGYDVFWVWGQGLTTCYKFRYLGAQF